MNLLKPNEFVGCAGSALLRWGLGALLLSTGLGKFYYQGKWSFENAKWFVTGYLLEDKLRESFLPKWLIGGFGYALPYLELTLAVLLLLGLWRNKVLFVTGLLMIILTIGAIQMKDYAVAHENMFFLLFCVVALFLDKYDKWRICCCDKNNHNPESY